MVSYRIVSNFIFFIINGKNRNVSCLKIALAGAKLTQNKVAMRPSNLLQLKPFHPQAKLINLFSDIKKRNQKVFLSQILMGY